MNGCSINDVLWLERLLELKVTPGLYRLEYEDKLTSGSKAYDRNFYFPRSHHESGW